MKKKSAPRRREPSLVNRHGCDRFAGNYTQILTIDRPAVIDLHRHGNESHVRRYELTRYAGTITRSLRQNRVW
jgi:hypothetical protein